MWLSLNGQYNVGYPFNLNLHNIDGSSWESAKHNNFKSM